MVRHRVHMLMALGRTAFDILVAPWPLFGLTLVLICIAGAVTPLAQIVATAGVIDAVTAQAQVPVTPPASLIERIAPVSGWVLLLVGAMFLGTLINKGGLQPYLFDRHAERVVERFNQQLVAKALRMRLEQFEHPAFYDMLYRFFWTMQSSTIISNRLSRLQRIITRLCGGLAIVWALGRVNWLLALTLLLGCSLIFRWRFHTSRQLISVAEAQTPLRRRQEYWRRLLTEREAAAENRLWNISDYVVAQWRSSTDQLLAELSTIRRKSEQSGIGLLVVNLLIFGVVTLGLVFAAQRGTISIGQLISLVFAVQQFLDLLQLDLDKLRTFFANLQYVPGFLALDGEESAEGLDAPDAVRDGIRFEQVGFAYPGANQLALHDINLHIRPGESIAVVGQNGSGKSTLAKLLLGLYSPTAGRIIVDGVDLQLIASTQWRERVGAVLQDFMRYACTVGQNIGFGRVARLDDNVAIEQAARASGATPIINGLPMGYMTLLGKEFEGGVDLSLGQWQALAIARAHLRDAPIVVLDEPGAALDAHAEREVYRQFLQLAAGKTVLMISHRIGSARLADRILVVHDGGIVQDGIHDDLIAAPGLYADLYKLQAAWYEHEEGRDHVATRA